MTTSTLVVGPTRRSSRVMYPTVAPTSSPSSSAIRAAAALAATRRGSNTTMRPLPNHPSPSSRNGTTVVLPAPGSACNTATPSPAKAARNSATTSSTGSPVGAGPGRSATINAE